MKNLVIVGVVALMLFGVVLMVQAEEGRLETLVAKYNEMVGQRNNLNAEILRLEGRIMEVQDEMQMRASDKNATEPKKEIR